MWWFQHLRLRLEPSVGMHDGAHWKINRRGPSVRPSVELKNLRFAGCHFEGLTCRKCMYIASKWLRWGWSGGISEGWRAGNARMLHQNGNLGLVGCHFGGLASRKCMYSASDLPFGVGRVPFWRVALAWPVVEGLSVSNCWNHQEPSDWKPPHLESPEAVLC